MHKKYAKIKDSNFKFFIKDLNLNKKSKYKETF